MKICIIVIIVFSDSIILQFDPLWIFFKLVLVNYTIKLFKKLQIFQIWNIKYVNKKTKSFTEDFINAFKNYE